MYFEMTIIVLAEFILGTIIIGPRLVTKDMPFKPLTL